MPTPPSASASRCRPPPTGAPGSPSVPGRSAGACWRCWRRPRLPDGANGAGAQGAAELAARLAPVLCLTRGRGYAVRDPRTEPRPGPRPVPGTVTVAVPVTEGGRVVATIGLTCFSGARIELGLLAGELKAAAGQIAGRSAEPERDPADGGTAPGRRGGAGPGETGPGETGPGGTGSGGGPS